jgi:Zn-dependent M28 family amino/carboxypeptidase
MLDLRSSPARRLRAPVWAAAALLAACGGGDSGTPTEAAQAVASPATCAKRANDNIAKLLECVTVDGVREHQAAFQSIADANGGTRAANTPGYDASLDYVQERLENAGYRTTRDPFDYQFVPPAVLEQLTPVSAMYQTGGFTGGAPGTVTPRAVIPVDINLVPPRANTSGCDGAFTEAAVGAPIVPDPDGPDDFAGFSAGAIALIQRGGCSFGLKTANAQAAGAGAVIIFNQGNDPSREGLIVGTVAPLTANIPVVGASFNDGVALSQAGSTARIVVHPAQTVTQYNLIAESVGGDPNNVVMAGAHLDSVDEGPGINDNGSGSAVLIEVAEQMAKVKPRNKLRFAWWGAEEAGLVGSTAYVTDQVAAGTLGSVALYLNFDMVGSPNHVFFIYDGDNSDGVGSGAGPEGSAAIEKTFERFYAERGIPFKGSDFTGRSDYGPFIAQGVPSGGLFTGAEGIKTAEETAIWGGTAGEQYDPCYHLACDTLANVNLNALDVNADAIAYATLKYAMSTQDVNNEKSKGNFKKLVVPYFPAQ